MQWPVYLCTSVPCVRRVQTVVSRHHHCAATNHVHNRSHSFSASRQSPCNREITWQQMDTQSFLRLKATAKKPSFANPEIMQVCELHLFEARRQTLLEMPEGLRYADEDQVFAPGQTRCMAARSGGRCRSAMAPGLHIDLWKNRH